MLVAGRAVLVAGPGCGVGSQAGIPDGLAARLAKPISPLVDLCQRGVDVVELPPQLFKGDLVGIKCHAAAG